MKKLILALFYLCLIATSLVLAKDVEPYRIYTVDVFLLPLVILITMTKVVRGDLLRINLCKLDIMVLAIFAVSAVSFLLSYSPLHSLVRLLDWIRVVLFYFIARVLFSNWRDTNLGRILFLVGIALLSVGMVQLLTGTSFGLIGDYFGSNYDQMARLSTSVGGGRRISGTTTSSIAYAIWINIYAGYGIARLLNDRKYLLASALASVSLIVLFYTFSRGAILTFFVYLMILTILFLKNIKEMVLGTKTVAALSLFLVVIIVAVSISAIKGSPPIIDKAVETIARRNEQIEKFEEYKRIKNLKFGLTLLQDPRVLLFGIGPGTFHQVASSKGYDSRPNIWRQDYSQSRSGIHNVPAKLLVEYGIITFILSGILCYRFIKLLWTDYVKRDGNRERQTWAIYIIALSASFIIVGAQVYEEPLEYFVMIPMAAITAYIVSNESQMGHKNDLPA